LDAWARVPKAKPPKGVELLDAWNEGQHAEKNAELERIRPWSLDRSKCTRPWAQGMAPHTEQLAAEQHQGMQAGKYERDPEGRTGRTLLRRLPWRQVECKSPYLQQLRIDREVIVGRIVIAKQRAATRCRGGSKQGVTHKKRRESKAKQGASPEEGELPNKELPPDVGELPNSKAPPGEATPPMSLHLSTPSVQPESHI